MAEVTVINPFIAAQDAGGRKQAILDNIEPVVSHIDKHPLINNHLPPHIHHEEHEEKNR
jgi:hypothetical protein